MAQKEIDLILMNIFRQIKNGKLERAWDVYNEFEKQLKNVKM